MLFILFLWRLVTPKLSQSSLCPTGKSFVLLDLFESITIPFEKMCPGLLMFFIKIPQVLFLLFLPDCHLEPGSQFPPHTLSFAVSFLVLRHPSLWHCNDPLKLCCLKFFSWLKFLSYSLPGTGMLLSIYLHLQPYP